MLIPIAVVVLAAAAPDAPQVRGPLGNGVVSAAAHPRAWSAERNLAWSVDVPGEGWSSPVVVGDRVFLTTASYEGQTGPANFQAGVSDPATRGQGATAPEKPITYQARCMKLSDGALLWEKTVGEAVSQHGIHPSNTYATESPATDGERLYVAFGMLGAVAALDLDGNELWQVSIGTYETASDFGTGSSLAVHDGRVFVQCDNEESSFLLAVRGADGKTLWRAERPKGTSWSTPVVWKNKARTELVALGRGAVTSYDPSTGDVLWKLEGIEGGFSASPGFDGERICFGNSGPRRRGPLVAVKAGAEGTHALDAEELDMLAWNAERAGPGFPSPLLYGDHVYVLGSMGVVACHDAKTGEQLWRERLPESASVVASPWAAGDTVFILDEAGKTFALKAGPTFEVLGVNDVPGLYWSTPSVAGDALLIRDAGKLHCIRENKP